MYDVRATSISIELNGKRFNHKKQHDSSYDNVIVCCGLHMRAGVVIKNCGKWSNVSSMAHLLSVYLRESMSHCSPHSINQITYHRTCVCVCVYAWHESNSPIIQTFFLFHLIFPVPRSIVCLCRLGLYLFNHRIVDTHSGIHWHADQRNARFCSHARIYTDIS